MGYKPTIIKGYEFDQVSSALQKSIRRSQSYESAYWTYLLHQSGYGLYLWRRLFVITSEDVGNANPHAPVLVSSLSQNWLLLHKHNKEMTLHKCMLAIQASVYLAESPKVREIDSLVNLIDHRVQSESEMLDIPDYAIDPHTQKGKSIYGKFGKDDGKEKERWIRWFEESALISNQASKDRWEKEFKEAVFSNLPEEK